MSQIYSELMTRIQVLEGSIANTKQSITSSESSVMGIRSQINSLQDQITELQFTVDMELSTQMELKQLLAVENESLLRLKALQEM